MSSLLLHIHELSHERARCLLAARVARCVGEHDLVTDLVTEARQYHKKLLIGLRMFGRNEVPTGRRPHHTFNMHTVAMHRHWLNEARPHISANPRKSYDEAC